MKKERHVWAPKQTVDMFEKIAEAIDNRKRVEKEKEARHG